MESMFDHVMGPSPEDGVPDMTVLSNVDETDINRNLKRRYEKDKIYTFTGSILVAVNPYKEIRIYEQENVVESQGKKLHQVEPHIFAISEAAIQSLCHSGDNQSCIISGESGSGKTESTKYILQYLCSVTNQTSFWTEQQILEANTVLEAFGNAKTVRNDNSSRFGKFMQVCFDADSHIKGCIVQDYLLEQSRITFQSVNERNYHVFYELVAAAEANPQLAGALYMEAASSYNYLNQSNCYTLVGVDDAQLFDNMRLAMNVLNISEEMMNGIFAVLSAVLLLGNLTFQDDDEEKTELTGRDQEILSKIVTLLGFELQPFTDVCLFRQIQVRGTVTCIPFKVQEASENRHAMAKALYSRTFAWLVDAINKCTNPGSSRTHFIGILDIFGFENFQINSFEQLCINYTNEKLHKFFNHYVFLMEQEQYREEEIHFSHISFTDNSKCVELIEKTPKCILKILDEECRFPKGTDKSYLVKQHQEFGEHSCYLKGQDRRVWEHEFGVKHYAGVVIYNVLGFLDKNKDAQQDQLFELMYSSHNEFVTELTRFQDLLGVRLEVLDGRQTISRTTRSKPTVGDTFKHQLSALVDVLATTNPWYVRCLKPNSLKKENMFVDEEVLTQLRYSGMLDIIRIKKEGYPVHMDNAAFVRRYRALQEKNLFDHDQTDLRPLILSIIQELEIPSMEWQIGKSKVFLKNVAYQSLEMKHHECVTAKALYIQKRWKGFTRRREFLLKRKAVSVLQSNFRCFASRLDFLRKRKAAIVIQSHFRGWQDRKKVKALKEEKLRQLEKEYEKALEDDEAIQKSVRESRAELESLSSLIESMWSQYQPPVSPNSLDLDCMFRFLQPDRADCNPAAATDMEVALHQINEEFDVLGSLIINEQDSRDCVLEEEEVKQALEQVDNSIAEFDDAKYSKTNPSEEDTMVDESLNEPEPHPDMPMPSNFPADFSKNDELSVTYNDTDKSDLYQEISPIIPKYDDSSFPYPPPPPPPPPPPTPPLPPPRRGSSLSQTSALAVEVQPFSGIHPVHQEQMAHDSPESEEKLSSMMLQQTNSIDQQANIKDCQNNIGEQEVFHDILEFAAKHFNSHVKDSSGSLMRTLRKRRPSDMECCSFQEMLTFSKSGVIPTSMIQLHDRENIDLSCTVFKELTRVMRGDLKDDVTMQIMQMIVKVGISHIELRDEIFCQLLKQTNGNPEADSLLVAWVIFCLCTAAFSPSKSFHKYLVTYVKLNCSDALIGKYALMCHNHLKVSRIAARRLPPSAIEIMSVRALSPIICKVYFMDGKTKAVSILPCDTSTELLQRLSRKIGLHSPDGWAIYEITKYEERYVRRYEYVSDILAEWEHLEKHSSNENHVNGRPQPLDFNFEMDLSFPKLLFKKRVYRHVHDIVNDPVEHHLLYAEAVHKVVQQDEFYVSEKVAVQLAGLQAQVIWGRFNDGKTFRYSEAAQYLPGRILASSGRNWSLEIAKAHQHFGDEKTELEAKVWYLKCVQQFPLYGCTLFPIINNSLWPHTSDSLLAVNMDGLKFVRSKDKSVIKDVLYSDIDSVSLDPNDNFVTVTVSVKSGMSGDVKEQLQYVFESPSKDDIGQLISSYSPPHASSIRPELEDFRKLKMSDDEKLKVYEEIVRCRRALTESRMLQHPQSENSPGFLRSTLRRLTKTKLEKLRASSTFSSDMGSFSVSYWSYSKSALRQSLTVIRDPSVEEVAVRMFNSILVYAGVLEAKDGNSNFGMIQNLLQKCLENDHLNNELYLQLVKQTTDHPDPNSHVNCMCWQLISVAAGVLPPANTRVHRYLQVHLKKCSLDATTEEGKYARFCLKTLGRTSEAKRRKFSPSTKEIGCLVQRKAITEEISFLNGEHRVIEFDSATTCGEVMKIIKTKIGMKFEAEGFTIYEVMNGSERSMSAEEKLSDTLSKWERISQSGAMRDFKLFFKKQLFIDPCLNYEDRVECDLIFRQLMKDVLEERLPISTHDACKLKSTMLIGDFNILIQAKRIRLCALKIQAEIEDMKSGEIDYSAVTQILPWYVRSSLRTEDISTTHKTVLDMSPQNAVLSIIEVFKSWPFFGATVFEVGQTYTSSLPQQLFVAVHQRGIHLLQKRSFNVLDGYTYEEIRHFSPAIKSIMIIVGHVAKGKKFVFNTNQASQMACVMKAYVEQLQTCGYLQPDSTKFSTHAFCHEDFWENQ